MVRAPPCHGGSCGFESRPDRQFRLSRNWRRSLCSRLRQSRSPSIEGNGFSSRDGSLRGRCLPSGPPVSAAPKLAASPAPFAEQTCERPSIPPVTPVRFPTSHQCWRRLPCSQRKSGLYNSHGRSSRGLRIPSRSFRQSRNEQRKRQHGPEGIVRERSSLKLRISIDSAGRRWHALSQVTSGNRADVLRIDSALRNRWDEKEAAARSRRDRARALKPETASID